MRLSLPLSTRTFHRLHTPHRVHAVSPWGRWLLALPLSACSGGGSDKGSLSTTPVQQTAVLTTINVAISPAGIQVGQSPTALARGLDQFGAAFSIGALTWSSGSETIAAVSSQRPLLRRELRAGAPATGGVDVRSPGSYRLDDVVVRFESVRAG